MNILTFDIEDWFHTHQNRHQYSGHLWKELPSKVEEDTDRILEMLDELELKATFFILGWVAEHHPRLVKKIRAKGHEIGAHSHWHHNPQLLSPESFEKDLVLCLSAIEDVTGEKVAAYRAPGFNLKLKHKASFEILASHGITIDSSVQLSKPPESIPFLIKTEYCEVLEFPLVTTGYGLPYSGGGYFRALPLPLVKYLFQKHPYHLFYFHPRDFDPDFPVTNLFSFYRNRMNRYRTGKCMSRLTELLRQYKTGSMGDAAASFLQTSKSGRDG